jgi:hypothetical protein
MLGATLGGGVGIMQGIHGLLLDSLESVQLVSASGDLVVSLSGLKNYVESALISYLTLSDSI